MNPIECIKQGIIKENWEIVCKGYEQLTGERLVCPTGIANNKAKETLDKIIIILDSYPDINAFVQSHKIDDDDHNDIVAIKEKIKQPKTKQHKKKSKKPKSTVTKDGEDSSLQLNESDRTNEQIGEGGVHFITNEIDLEEVEINKKRAAKSRRYKLELNRGQDPTYNVICNECESEFKSKIHSGEMGQKCKKCLSGLRGRLA